MRLILKEFNALKIVNYLYTHRLIFFFQGVNLKTKSWVKIEQCFYKKKLTYYQLNNAMSSIYFKNSVFKNILASINSTNFFIHIEPTVLPKPNYFKQILDLDSLFYLLFIKLNNKIYYINNKTYEVSLNYKTLLKNFTFLLSKSSTIPITYFKKISINKIKSK